MSTRLLQLTGSDSFNAPSTYGYTIRRNQIGRWRATDAQVLLMRQTSDAAGNVTELFTEVWAVEPLYDFSAQFSKQDTGDGSITINPEVVADRRPFIPRGTKLRDETGIPYGVSDGKGGYVRELTEADQVNAASDVSAKVSPATMAQADRISTEREAAGFLQKATLGPRYAEIQALVTVGSKRDWVLDQFKKKLTKRYMDRSYFDQGVTDLGTFEGDVESTYLSAFHEEAATLRTKLTWSLSKLFVISQPGGAFDDNRRVYSFVSWLDRLDKYVFGNWRDLIESITYSLHMSRMLTFYANEKASGTRQPDENYARELMQLFSIGLYELNPDGTRKLDDNGDPIPTYTNDDIRQVARCLTGLTRWDFNGTTERYDIQSTAGDTKFRTDFLGGHQTLLFGDPDAKLRHYLPAYEYGGKYALNGQINIPTGTDPVTNLKMLHDALFNHPNTAPFFAVRMIQMLVTSNPSPAYVARVSAAFEDNGLGVRGDLKAVWLAILTDPEAASDGRSDRMFGRMRDGFDLWYGQMRSLNRVNNAGKPFIYPSGTVSSFITDFGNCIFRMQPSIFGAADPLHSPAELLDKGILAPEALQWSEVLVVRGMNHFCTQTVAGEPRDTATATSQISDYSMLPLTGTAAEMTERLNLLLCGGKMSDGLRADLLVVLTSVVAWQTPGSMTTDQQQERASVALQMVLDSTDYWTQL